MRSLFVGLCILVFCLIGLIANVFIYSEDTGLLTNVTTCVRYRYVIKTHAVQKTYVFLKRDDGSCDWTTQALSEAQ